MLGQNHAEIGGNMAIWNDIKLWLTSQEMDFADKGEFIDLFFDYTNVNRTQQLRIQHAPLDNGQDAITILSFIAGYDPLKTELLLLKAYEGVGGVSIQEFDNGSRYFVLKNTVPLADLDASEIDFHIRTIADRADTLEAEIFRVDNM